MERSKIHLRYRGNESMYLSYVSPRRLWFFSFNKFWNSNSMLGSYLKQLKLMDLHLVFFGGMGKKQLCQFHWAELNLNEWPNVWQLPILEFEYREPSSWIYYAFWWKFAVRLFLEIILLWYSDQYTCSQCVQSGWKWGMLWKVWNCCAKLMEFKWLMMAYEISFDRAHEH